MRTKPSGGKKHAKVLLFFDICKYFLYFFLNYALFHHFVRFA